MRCQYCSSNCHKAGRQKNGAQKFYCRSCKKYQQSTYKNKAYAGGINQQIIALLCEGVCVRGIGRILKIAINTVQKRIKIMAMQMNVDSAERDDVLEVDELWTYIGRKKNDYWLAYAFSRRTGQVIDFTIGKRTKHTLKGLIDRLLVLHSRHIRTDKLRLYQRLIPKSQHRFGSYCINRIERKNLSIRTHLKRLSRRTICFSRSLTMLESCLRIYFWR